MKINYTLKEFFKSMPLTQEGVAEEAKITPNMMRQYIGGFKKLPDEKLEQIQKAVNKIGKHLVKVKLK